MPWTTFGQYIQQLPQLVAMHVKEKVAALVKEFGCTWLEIGTRI